MAVDFSTLDPNGLPVGLLDRLGLVESGNNPSAVSPKGAIGQYQLMPATAKALGVDPNSPQQNRDGAITYLQQLNRRYSGDWPLTLAAYNEGPTRLDRSGVLPQTAAYVAKVTGMPDAMTSFGLPSMPSVLGQVLATQKAVQSQQDSDPQYKAAKAESDQGRDEAIKSLTGIQAQMGQDASQLRQIKAPDAPTLEKTPDAPKDQPGDPKRALGQFLPLLAILGGAMSHKFALSAIQAATGAMQGAHEGDMEKVKLHHDQWEDAMQKVLEDNKAQLNAFDASMKKFEGDKAGLMADLQVQAAMQGNTHLLELLKAGNLDEYYKSREMQRYGVQQVDQTYNHILEQNRFAQQQQTERDKIPPATQAYNNWLAQHPGDFEGAAKAAGQVTSETRMSRSGVAMAMQKYMQEHPDATDEDVSQEYARIQAEAAGTKAFATGKQGQAVNSFNVALSHLDTLGELADALKNGNSQTLNKARNAYQAEFGSEAPTDFNAAKQIVGAELVKAISNTGGTGADREKAQAAIDAIKTPEQLKGAIQTYQKLLAGQLHGLAQEYKTSTGRDDFDTHLSDQAKRLLGGGSSNKGGKYHINQIIEHGGKKYRVTGGDMNDPDVEEVK